MSAQARDARIQRLQTMASDHTTHDLPPLLVPGALFEATLRGTLLLPPAILQPQADGASPLRRLVAQAAAAAPPSRGATAVGLSWWLESAAAVAGLNATDAHLLFDLAVSWGGDLGRALERPSIGVRGPFLSLGPADPTVVRALNNPARDPGCSVRTARAQPLSIYALPDSVRTGCR